MGGGGVEVLHHQSVYHISDALLCPTYVTLPFLSQYFNSTSDGFKW